MTFDPKKLADEYNRARLFFNAVKLNIGSRSKNADAANEALLAILESLHKLSVEDQIQLSRDVEAFLPIMQRWNVRLLNMADAVPLEVFEHIREPDFPTIHDDDVIQGAIKTLRYAYELGPEDTLGQMTYDLIEWACAGVGRTIRDDASLADALMSVAKTLDRCSPSQGRGPERTTTTTDLRERLVYWAEDIDKVLDGDNVTVGSLGELVHQALEMRAEVIGCDLKANIDAFAQYTLAAALR